MNQTYRPNTRDMEARMRAASAGYRGGSNKAKDSGKIGGKGFVFLWLGIVVLFSISGAFGAIALFVGIFLLVIWVIRAATKTGTVAKPSARPAAYNSSPSAGGHLCDPGQHSREEDRNGREALDDMQEGYRPYSGAPSYNYRAAANYSYAARGRMSKEQYQKKLDELKSLRDAGIITEEEYRFKVKEYSSFVS